MTFRNFTILCLTTAISLTLCQNAVAQGSTARGNPMCTPASSATGTVPTAAQLRQVDRDFAAQFALQKYAGLTAGVVVGGQLVWTRSYGLADIENKVPTTEATVFNMGSIGKQFTAVMLLQLIERGKVHASDPVSMYVPEISQIQNPFPNASPPTLFQLATHTAGFPGDNTQSRGPQGARDQWEQLLISLFPQTKYEFEPGTRYQYSNMGYSILGLALERAAGQKYLDYLPQQILVALGMTHTGYDLTPDMAARVARGYVINNGVPMLADDPTRQPNDGRPYFTPAGGEFTTLDDMAKFLSFELGHGPESVLSAATIADNFSRVASASGDFTFGYGVGFDIQRQGDFPIVGHNGASTMGYYATVNFAPGTDVGVVFLRNIFSPTLQYNPFDVLNVLTCATHGPGEPF